MTARPVAVPDYGYTAVITACSDQRGHSYRIILSRAGVELDNDMAHYRCGAHLLARRMLRRRRRADRHAATYRKEIR